MNKEQIASYIDHTALNPCAGVNEIELLCQEAVSNKFASVCVNSYYVPFAVTALKDSKVKVCTVIGFPLGAASTKAKVSETKDAVLNGADEVDMVINIGAVKDGRYTVVGSDIAAVVKEARKCGEKLHKKIIVKVILETCFLEDSEIVNCCLCAKKAGADFVKTSTGFASPKDRDGTLLPNGASEHHVKLMRDTVGEDMGVKASGGIRTVSMAVLMLESGADRIGTSSGVKIIQTWDENTEIKNLRNPRL